MHKICRGWFAFPKLMGLPPVIFTLALGVIAFVTGPYIRLPAALLGLIYGFVASNFLLLPLYGIPPDSDTHYQFKWTEGLTFIDKMMPRIAVVLQGFTLQYSLLREHPSKLAMCAIIIPFSQVTALLLALITTRLVGLDAVVGHMLGIGTMICGASAIAALTSVYADQRKEEQTELTEHQALSTTAIFVFSIIALVVFHPIAKSLGINNMNGGLWGGLAVNDLSLSLAVGSQFGDVGLTFATLAKTVRILTMIVWLPLFSAWAGRADDARPRRVLGQVWATFPLFIIGFIALFLVRVLVDHVAKDRRGVEVAAEVIEAIVVIIMSTVCASIGIKLQLRKILVSWRYFVAEVSACCGISALTLGMLELVDVTGAGIAVVPGVVAVLVLGAVYLLMKLLCVCCAKPVDRAHEC